MASGRTMPMSEAPQGMRRNIRLRDLLAVVAVMSLLGSIVVARIAWARLVEQRKVKCASHLKTLNAYCTLWGAKMTTCSGTFPPEGVLIPYNDCRHAVGRDVLDALRTYPTRQQSLCPDHDELFTCPVCGTAPSPAALDYRVPSPATPGGAVRLGWTQPEYPVVCDRPTNHSPGGDDDINILLFSGAVIRARPGSPEWDTAMSYTQDP